MIIKQESSALYKVIPGVSRCQCCDIRSERLKLLEGPNIYICYKCHAKLRQYQRSPIQPIPLSKVPPNKVTPANIKAMVQYVNQGRAAVDVAGKAIAAATVAAGLNAIFSSGDEPEAADSHQVSQPTQRAMPTSSIISSDEQI